MTRPVIGGYEPGEREGNGVREKAQIAVYDRIGTTYTATRRPDPRIAAAVRVAPAMPARSRTSAPAPARTSRATSASSRWSPRGR